MESRPGRERGAARSRERPRRLCAAGPGAAPAAKSLWESRVGALGWVLFLFRVVSNSAVVVCLVGAILGPVSAVCGGAGFGAVGELPTSLSFSFSSPGGGGALGLGLAASPALCPRRERPWRRATCCGRGAAGPARSAPPSPRPVTAARGSRPPPPSPPHNDPAWFLVPEATPTSQPRPFLPLRFVGFWSFFVFAQNACTFFARCECPPSTPLVCGPPSTPLACGGSCPCCPRRAPASWGGLLSRPVSVTSPSPGGPLPLDFPPGRMRRG